MLNRILRMDPTSSTHRIAVLPARVGPHEKRLAGPGYRYCLGLWAGVSWNGVFIVDPIVLLIKQQDLHGDI